MKIKDWEKYVTEKYGAVKVTEFDDLKNYLSDQRNYAHNFTPEEITETEIMNDEYYGAYVFDENKIAGREVRSTSNSGWNATVVFIASDDKVNISNYFIHESNELTRTEMDNFCNDINPLK